MTQEMHETSLLDGELRHGEGAYSSITSLDGTLLASYGVLGVFLFCSETRYGEEHECFEFSGSRYREAHLMAYVNTAMGRKFYMLQLIGAEYDVPELFKWVDEMDLPEVLATAIAGLSLSCYNGYPTKDLPAVVRANGEQKWYKDGKETAPQYPEITKWATLVDKYRIVEDFIHACNDAGIRVSLTKDGGWISIYAAFQLAYGIDGAKLSAERDAVLANALKQA